MAPILRVLSPGFLTTVQDAGRPGLGSSGIPRGGALDAEALFAANVLAGNRGEEAGLEAWYVGPRLLASAPVAVVVAGGPFGPSPGRVVELGAGDEITIRPSGTAGPSARCVVAVSGGIDVPPLLGSRSTLLSAAFGGLDGRALRSGDELPLGVPGAPPRTGAALLPGLLGEEGETVTLRIGPGADLALFPRAARERFFATAWTMR